MLDSSDELWRSYAFSRRALGDRYRLDDLVAARGASAFFRATDLSTGESVAVEVVNPGRTPGAEADRFRQRARTAAALPAAAHLLRAADWGADDELTYLVVEPVAGVPLDAWIRTNAHASLGARVHVLAQAARGLEAAHGAGLIHGAFTAASVLVDGSDEPSATVAGFGLGEMVAALSGSDAAPWAGSSPEQLRRDPRLTPATDVYGVGLLAYHLLAGAEPFTDRDRVDLRNRRPVHPAVPDVVNPDLPPALSRVITRALSPEPLRRYADAGAFADALRRVVAETEGSGWREKAGPRWPVMEPILPPIPAASAEPDATAPEPIGAPRAIPLGLADATVLADAKIAFERARTPIAPHPLKPELIDARRMDPTLERRGAWAAADAEAGDDELDYAEEATPRGRSWAGVLMVGGMALFGGALLGAAGWTALNQMDGAQATRAMTAATVSAPDHEAQPEPNVLVETAAPAEVLVTTTTTITDTVQTAPVVAQPVTVDSAPAVESAQPEPAAEPSVREPAASAPAETPRDEPEPKAAPRPAEPRAEPEPKSTERRPAESRPAEPRQTEPRTEARAPRDTVQLDEAPTPRPRRDAPRDTIRIPR